MRIAILGGTGKLGRNLAMQLSRENEVAIGSRDPARAREAARRIRGGIGADYEVASRWGDTVIFSLPYSAIASASALADALAGKLAISVVNPLKSKDGLFHFALESGSAAEQLAKLLPRSRIATAFNNVPYAMLSTEDPVPMDILIAADSGEIYEEAARVVRYVPNLRPLHVGPLSEAGLVERVTALVLNLAKLNRTGALTTKFAARRTGRG